MSYGQPASLGALWATALLSGGRLVGAIYASMGLNRPYRSVLAKVARAPRRGPAPGASPMPDVGDWPGRFSGNICQVFLRQIVCLMLCKGFTLVLYLKSRPLLHQQFLRSMYHSGLKQFVVLSEQAYQNSRIKTDHFNREHRKKSVTNVLNWITPLQAHHSGSECAF